MALLRAGLRAPVVGTRIRTLLADQGIVATPDCETGFLFGDACLWLILVAARGSRPRAG